jgi:hypothetical protein
MELLKLSNILLDMLLNARCYELEYKKYAILTLQRGHDAALSTELHRSDTELISMCQIFMYTQDNSNTLEEHHTWLSTSCDPVEIGKQR